MSERVQIELLAEEYRSRGYTVVTEAAVDIPSLAQIRVDIFASNTQEQVIVEIVNKDQRTSEELLARAQRIASALGSRPGWRVEFRFVEGTGEQISRRRAVAGSAPRLTEFRPKLISRRSGAPDRLTQIAVGDWWIWTRGLRLLAALTERLDPADDIADLAEDLIQAGVVRAHARVEHSQVQEALLAALEGDFVPLEIADALRWYVTDLRIALRSVTRQRTLQRQFGTLELG